MSNALHQVAPASFFPTAKELSSGLKWFKDHPILAAAAATAVSVITYLNTADGTDESCEITNITVEEEELKEELDDSVYAHRRTEVAKTVTTMTTSSTTATTATVHGSTRVRRSSASSGRATPPALRKPGSDGKMSPAAVSWVDEHGGSLTQVFEDLSVAEDRYPDLDGPLRTPERSSHRHTSPPVRHGLPPHPPKTESETTPTPDNAEDHRDVTPSGMNHSNTIGTPELQTESPQWGWYVAITPPQDHHNCHTNLPRGIPQPPPRHGNGKAVGGIAAATGSSGTGRRAPIVHPTSGSSAEPTKASAMRRSTSGRIVSSA